MQLKPETLDAFRSADEATQRQALSRMSTEAKQALLAQLKGAAPDNTAILQQQAEKYPTSMEQGGMPGQAVRSSAGAIVGGAVRNPTVSTEVLTADMSGGNEILTGLNPANPKDISAKLMSVAAP